MKKEIDQAAAKNALHRVQRAQARFFQALADLEDELGIELSRTEEYEALSLEDLTTEHVSIYPKAGSNEN